MARFRLGFLGAILLVLATFAAQMQPVPTGFGIAMSGAEETTSRPGNPATGLVIGADLWDETDDDLDVFPAASGPAVAPAPLRLIAARRPDASLPRQRPRATGPPRP